MKTCSILAFDYKDTNISRNLYHGCIIYSPFLYLLARTFSFEYHTATTSLPSTHSNACHQHRITDTDKYNKKKKNQKIILWVCVMWESGRMNAQYGAQGSKRVRIFPLLDSVLHSFSCIFLMLLLLLLLLPVSVVVVALVLHLLSSTLTFQILLLVITCSSFIILAVFSCCLNPTTDPHIWIENIVSEGFFGSITKGSWWL